MYVWGDAGVEIIDDSKIWNHTPTPNTGTHPDTGESLGSYALRDIEAGEEFTDDYGNHHELPWFEALCKEYQCTSCTDLGKSIRQRLAAVSNVEGKKMLDMVQTAYRPFAETKQ